MREDADPHHGGANHEMQHFVPEVTDQHRQQNISLSYDLLRQRNSYFQEENLKNSGSSEIKTAYSTSCIAFCQPNYTHTEKKTMCATGMNKSKSFEIF